MSITLKPLEELRINGKTFVVQPDPNPDMSHHPYVEWGGSGQVVQLSLAKTEEFHALKVFNNPDNSLINNTKKLEKNNVQSLPGLAAANRVVIDPKAETYSALLKKYPYLEYSVLMPWIGGYTWFEILGDKNGDKKILNFSQKTSLYYAWQLAYVLGTLEKKKYAHCDICSNNIILDLRTPSVQLIDIEDMYMPGGKKKEDFIGGQNGYAHPNRPLGHQWVQESDRFGGGLLISEILTWHDPEIREASDTESFYLNSELCKKTKKYKLMRGVLERNGGLELANLFDKVWNSNGLEDCPKLSEWESQLHSLVQNANVKSPEIGDLSGLGADGRIRVQRKKVSLNDKGEEKQGNIKPSRHKVDVSSPSYSQQKVQPARSFQPKTDWGKVVGFILVAVLILFICIALSSALAAGAIYIGNTPLPSSTSTSSYVVPAAIIVTKTMRSTPTQVQVIKPTKTQKPADLTGYSCPDKSKIKLRVGMRAIVPYYDVNLREEPIVPEVWDANIVVMLRQGDTMLVIGGPKCAHEGTWWEVKTDQGYTGWVRELQPNKILLEPSD